MYAVIETGGKQHKVEKGMVLSIDLLKDDLGKKIMEIIDVMKRLNEISQSEIT